MENKRKYHDLASRLVNAIDSKPTVYDAIEAAEEVLENDVKYAWARMANVHDQEVRMWKRGAMFGVGLTSFVATLIALALFL